jgi:hypothetical protein
MTGSSGAVVAVVLVGKLCTATETCYDLAHLAVLTSVDLTKPIKNFVERDKI